jgi:hypothetical protein
MTKWSEEEIILLETEYPQIGPDIPKLLIRYTRIAIICKANKLKINYRFWTKKEIEILKKNYKKNGSNIPELLTKYTKKAIQKKGQRLGILTKERIKNIDVSRQLHSILDGLILGDAHIECNGKTARLGIVQSENHKQWLNIIKESIEKNNMECSNIIMQHKGEERFIKGIKTKPKPTFHLRTLSYSDLCQYKNRWYDKNGKKIIPDDVDISPISLAQWHMGDGTYYKSHGKYPKITFSTDCFNKEDIEKLIRKLKKRYAWILNYYKVRENYRIILYGKKQVSNFLELTKDFKADCFNYKWGEVAQENPSTGS